MPTKYKGKIYLTFGGLKKAVKANHPSWPEYRVNAYAGAIHRKEKPPRFRWKRKK